MTPARRAFVALCIALATALAVAGVAILDGGRAPEEFERIHRD